MKKFLLILILGCTQPGCNPLPAEVNSVKVRIEQIEYTSADGGGKYIVVIHNNERCLLSRNESSFGKIWKDASIGDIVEVDSAYLY